MDNIKSLYEITNWTHVFYTDYSYFRGLYQSIIIEDKYLPNTWVIPEFIEGDILWKK